MRRLVPLIFVIALVVLAGCGSSSGNSGSATDAATSGEGALTKAEFVTEADVLCEAAKAKQEPLRKKLEEAAHKARAEEQGSEGLTDGTRRELAQTLGRLVALAEADLSRVQALGFPKTGAGQLEAMFQKIESSFRSSLAYGAALERHEDAEAQAIVQKADAETREAAAMAVRYGFQVCGARP